MALTLCMAASSPAQTVRDLRLDSPVDSNTIAVAYSAVTNAIATAVRLGRLDQNSLARAIAVGQDLALIESATDGWVVAVSNIVEVDQAHVPGVLFVGSIIYGAPRDGGYISITGAPFFYDRQIPGSTNSLAGFGEVVTDPYMDWRLGTFYARWAAQTNAMWDALETLAGLPDTIAGDLATYNTLTNVQADVTAIRDDINATNAVIYATITNALAQATSGGGGQSWTTATTSSKQIDCADHCITISNRLYNWDDWQENEITIVMPTSTGTAHSKVVFMNAYDLGSGGANIQYSYGTDETMFPDDSAWGFQMQIPYWNPDTYDIDYTYASYSVVMIDIQEVGSGIWVVSWKGFDRQ